MKKFLLGFLIKAMWKPREVFRGYDTVFFSDGLKSSSDLKREYYRILQYCRDVRLSQIHQCIPSRGTGDPEEMLMAGT